MLQRIAKDQNWAKLTPVLGLLAAIWLVVFFKPSDVLFWAYINIPLYLFHQAEEHFWPGGFKRFMNQTINHLPEGQEKLNDISIFWINIGLVWVAFSIFGYLAFVNIGFGLLIIVFSIMNCLTHIVQGLRLKRWNPGLVMASLQFVVSIYAAYFVTINGLTDPLLWWIATVIFSGLVHLMLFRFILKERSGHS